MELVFESEKELYSGSSDDVVAVMKDETLCVLYLSDNQVKGRVITMDVANVTNSSIGSEFTVDKSRIAVVGLESSTVNSNNFITLRTPTKHRVFRLSGNGVWFVVGYKYKGNSLAQLV